MSSKQMLGLFLGLGLTLGGCAFHPDLGDRPQCDRDADCAEYGDCACVGGKCVPASPGAGCDYESYCEAPKVRCDEDCADLQADTEHCGDCDVVCGPGERCAGGKCTCGAAGPCDPDLTCCSGTCVDTRVSSDHCGLCDHTCQQPPSPHCELNDQGDAVLIIHDSAGVCLEGDCFYESGTTVCPDGCQEGACIDDPCHGPCVSPPSPWCQGDELQIPVATGECVDGVCEYALESSIYCELGCDSNAAGCIQPACSAGADCGPGETCSNGTCLCGPHPGCTQEQTCCAGVCADLRSDPDHCGECDVSCQDVANADASCHDGACKIDQCQAPFRDCNQDPDDGCEAKSITDVEHCGQCNIQCNADQSCYNGTCGAQTDREVTCGLQGVVCFGGQFCCVLDGGNGECLSEVDSDGCAGPALYCDGPEDCPADGSCCLDEASQTTSCSADGPCQDGTTICHTFDDCGGLNIYCAEIDLGGLPLGLCLPT